MVDVGFKSRVANFVPLSLLRRIAALDAESDPPDDIAYIGKEGVTAVKGPSFNVRLRPKLTPTYAFVRVIEMALFTRGRPSVQRVEENAWKTVSLLAERGGWDDGHRKAAKGTKKSAQTKRKKPKDKEEVSDEPDADDNDKVPNEESSTKARTATSRKRKAAEVEAGDETAPLRRSTRAKK